MNPYKHYKLENGACLDCDACKWEAGFLFAIAALQKKIDGYCSSKGREYRVGEMRGLIREVLNEPRS